MANPIPYTEPRAPLTENKNAAMMKSHSWPLRLAALIFAVLSVLWLWQALLSREGTCQRLSSSAIPISFAAYYSLLAAGAFCGRRGNSFDLRSGPWWR
jgi:hypothetical protein